MRIPRGGLSSVDREAVVTVGFLTAATYRAGGASNFSYEELAGEKVHPILKPASELSLAGHRSSLFHEQDDVISRYDGSETSRKTVVESLGLRGTRKQIGPPQVDDAKSRVPLLPSALFAESDGAIALKCQGGITGGHATGGRNAGRRIVRLGTGRAGIPRCDGGLRLRRR